MRSDLRQVFFLAVFWFLCTIFVFFIPWWNANNNGNEAVENVEIEEELQMDEPVSIEFDWILRIWIYQGMESFNDTFSIFIENFKKNYWGDITIVPLSVHDITWEKVDLLLLPYDLLTGLELKTLLFQEDIKTLFIPQLSEFMTKHTEFIPFGIDQPVMYGLSSLWIGLDGLNQSAQNRNPTRSYAPFNFWISESEDVLDNSLISAQQVIDFIEVNNIWGFSDRINFTPTTQDLQSRLLNSIQWSSDNCKKHPLWCLIEKKMLGVARGFKSNYNEGFDSNLIERLYPYEGKLPFVRLYGFVLPSDTEQYAMATQFILDYMDYAFSDGSLSLAKDLKLIPVFQNEYKVSCHQDDCWLPQKFYILEGAFEKIKRFVDDQTFWWVIEKKVQPNLYLNTTLL